MPDFPPKSEHEEMTVAAQSMLRDYASRRWPTMNHKGRMSRLTDILKMGHRRVRAIYQNDADVRLRADEMAAIEALHQTRIEEGNRSDFQALQERVARLEAALAQVDAEFHEPSMAGFRQAVDGRRRDHGAGNPDTKTD